MTVIAAVDPAAAFLDVNATTPRPDADLIVGGRYRIPDPDTGKARTWQRATNFAGILDDPFGLHRWQTRQALKGLAAHDHLYLEVATAAGKDDLKALDALAEQAREAAGATSGRQKGTALHDLVERINRGEKGVTAPAPWDADLRAYRTEVDRLGLTPVTVEAVLVNTRYDVAGRVDLIARTIHRPLPQIADLKTGSINGKGLSIGVQLAVYATASHIYDPATGTFTPMPGVDQAEALVLHLPAGEGTCTTVAVDLRLAVELADLALEVRHARGKAKAVFSTFDPTIHTGPPVDVTPRADTPPDEPVADRTTWVRQRLTALAHSVEARAVVGRCWPAGVPAQPPWTDEQVEAVAAAVAEAEKEVGAPFPSPDPDRAPGTVTAIADEPVAPERCPDWPIVDDGAPADPGDDIAARARALGAGRLHALGRWIGDGRRHRCRFDEVPGTARTAAIARAAVACLDHLWDDDDPDALTRAAIAHATTGHPLPASWETGAVLGRLTLADAERVATIAAGFAADDDATLAALGELVAAAPAASTNQENPTP